jgi:hypothetical protein
LRGRFERGEISGLSDKALGEPASIGYVIDPRGRTAIEDKASVKSALGHSPDLAEALTLALGEPAYEPCRYTGLPRLPTSSPFDSAARRATCQAQGYADDAAGDATFFVNDPLQMRLPPGANSRRWGSLNRRKAW